MFLSCSGEKTNASTIRDNSEYTTLIRQLHSTKRSVAAILVAFDMDQMKPYRVCVGGVIDPRLTNWTGEPAFDTQVR